VNLLRKPEKINGWVPLAEAAEHFSFHPATLQAWCAAGKLPQRVAKKMGGRWRVNIEQFEKHFTEEG
jgi:predicted site-specific integrase-resolvase